MNQMDDLRNIMENQDDALRLASELFALGYGGTCSLAAAELRLLHKENELLMNALWKACGDDEEVVNATIDSQR